MVGLSHVDDRRRCGRTASKGEHGSSPTARARVAGAVGERRETDRITPTIGLGQPILASRFSVKASAPPSPDLTVYSDSGLQACDDAPGVMRSARKCRLSNHDDLQCDHDKPECQTRSRSKRPPLPPDRPIPCEPGFLGRIGRSGRTYDGLVLPDPRSFAQRGNWLGNAGRLTTAGVTSVLPVQSSRLPHVVHAVPLTSCRGPAQQVRQLEG